MSIWTKATIAALVLVSISYLLPQPFGLSLAAVAIGVSVVAVIANAAGLIRKRPTDNTEEKP